MDYLQPGEDTGFLGVGGEASRTGNAAEPLGFTVESISDPHHPTHLTGGCQNTHAHDQMVHSQSRQDISALDLSGHLMELFFAADESTSMYEWGS